MPDKENNPRYSTCRTCGRVIIDRGRGWYHQAGSRPPIGHFAEAVVVTK